MISGSTPATRMSQPPNPMPLVQVVRMHHQNVRDSRRLKKRPARWWLMASSMTPPFAEASRSCGKGATTSRYRPRVKSTSGRNSRPMSAWSTRARTKAPSASTGAEAESAEAWYVVRQRTRAPYSRPHTTSKEHTSQARTRSSPDLRGSLRSSQKEATSRHARRKASSESFWTDMPTALCTAKSLAARTAKARASTAAEHCNTSKSVR
mmetsp:Transcript_37316/g.100983  ORF Transcript_37316/g.100983 Transcript_37316/m.100983 type:complete len:208 (-) Transcript_37316:364-987(-)